MSRPQAATRSMFRVFTPIDTRWMDNDVYGHVNNVTYYSYFDTAVNGYLIESDALDIEKGQVIGLVVETGCAYFASASFPDKLDIGIKVARLGTTSVRYELGVFKKGEQTAAAQGHFVHVYVDRRSRRPTPLPERLKQVLEQLT